MKSTNLNVLTATTNWQELDQECAATELALVSESLNRK